MNTPPPNPSSFSPPPFGTPAAPARKGMHGCLLAFLIFVAMLFIAGAVGGFLLYRYAGTLAQQGGAFVIDQMAEAIVQDSSLSTTDKEAIKRSLGSLSGKVKAGEVSFEKIVNISTRVFEGPFISSLLAKAFETQYIGRLEPSQQADARNTIGRFAAGVVSGSISSEQANEVVGMFSDQKTDEAGNSETHKLEIKIDLSPTKVQEVISRMKALADQAGVAATAPEANIGAALETIISEELGKP